MFRILIIGAYGQFGQRIASELARNSELELILAGRNVQAANDLLSSLRIAGRQARMRTAALDIDAAGLHAELASMAPDLVIHTAGPFQKRDYRVAKAALSCGAHYVDLADGREYVMGIGHLDAEARASGRWVISGASSVPGLSAAVVEAHRSSFGQLHSVESAISPGNRTPRGLATTQAILGYVGRSFPALLHGEWKQVHGWQSLRRIDVPGLAARWVARCDVPDLAVLPARYPELRHCDFRAGLELRRMHWGLWVASWAVRWRLWPGMERWAQPLLRISKWWMRCGSNTGVMTIQMCGTNRQGEPNGVQWQIVASEGSGPQIPATAAVVLARKLARGDLPGSGARACLDFFSVEEFMEALDAFPIRASTRVLSS